MIVAPDFAPDALAHLQKKKNLRLLITRKSAVEPGLDVRAVGAGSFLLQDRDTKQTRGERLEDRDQTRAF